MYEQYYHLIELQKSNFKNLINELNNSGKFDEQLRLAEVATNYALHHNTGYYYSPSIEKFYCNLGNFIKTDLSGISFKPNSFLHIMTQGYLSGGHTRVVERWIEQAQDNQSHSVLFTVGQDDELPRLEKAVSKTKGQLYFLDQKLCLEDKVNYIRKLASEYEYIVLHVHMDDPLPLIAFSCKNFVRPIMFYNHASHQFWLGKSIADLVLDIENNDIVTSKYRGISNNIFLGVPTNTVIHQKTQEDIVKARTELGLPLDKNIILTAGNNTKYMPIGDFSYSDIFLKLKNQNNFFIVIGVNPKDQFWQKIKAELGDNIIIYKTIDFEQGFLNYLIAADLFLDSYPLCGGTVVIDAISVGTPVLSLESAYPQFDYLIKTHAYCKDPDDFYNKVTLILSNPDFKQSLYNELVQSLTSLQSQEVWNERLKTILSKLPKKHNTNIEFIEAYSIPSDLSVLCNVLSNSNFCEKKDIYQYSKQDISYIKKYGNLVKVKKVCSFIEKKTFKTKNYKTKIIFLFKKAFFTKKSKI